jgi:hypothetical protein
MKRSIVISFLTVAVVMSSAVSVFADSLPVFSSYADAQKYVYQKMMRMEPCIDYVLELDSTKGFDNYTSTSCSSLYKFDDGKKIDGDYAANGLYNGDNITWKGSEYEGGSCRYTIHDEVQYRLTKAEQRAYTSRRKKVREALKLKGSNYAKFMKIYRWICGNVRYSSGRDSAYDALVKKKANCNGYACLLYDLCRDCGIPCRIVTGSAGGGGHAWNLVKIGKKWYFCDSTWDSGNKKFSYCLRGENMAKTHRLAKAYRSSAFQKAFPVSRTNFRK